MKWNQDYNASPKLNGEEVKLSGKTSDADCLEMLSDAHAELLSCWNGDPANAMSVSSLVVRLGQQLRRRALKIEVAANMPFGSVAVRQMLSADRKMSFIKTAVPKDADTRMWAQVVGRTKTSITIAAQMFSTSFVADHYGESDVEVVDLPKITIAQAVEIG